MAGVNKVILVGNLGKDPEVRHLESGAVVTSFPIATSETYKDRNTGERREQTEWHNIVLWRGLAEVAEKYLHKGDQVYIEGKLRTRSWEKDGITRYTTEVVGDNMTMLGSRSSGGNGGTGQEPSHTQQSQTTPSTASTTSTQGGNSSMGSSDEEVTDDLPF